MNAYSLNSRPKLALTSSSSTPPPHWQASGQDDDPSPIHPSGVDHYRAYALTGPRCPIVAQPSNLRGNRKQISLHYILSFSHEEYGRKTSLANIKDKLTSSSGKPPYQNGIPAEYYDTGKEDKEASPPQRKANAAIVSLARNGDIDGILFSMKQMEDRFNRKYGYPYVFLNEEEFSEDFKS